MSLYKLEIDKEACIECGACTKKCPVSLDVPRQLDNAECLRCLECKSICPVKVINLSGPGIKTELLTPAQTAEIKEQTD